MTLRSNRRTARGRDLEDRWRSTKTSGGQPWPEGGARSAEAMLSSTTTNPRRLKATSDTISACARPGRARCPAASPAPHGAPPPAAPDATGTPRVCQRPQTLRVLRARSRGRHHGSLIRWHGRQQRPRPDGLPRADAACSSCMGALPPCRSDGSSTRLRGSSERQRGAPLPLRRRRRRFRVRGLDRTREAPG
jgi:hypothetical protein